MATGAVAVTFFSAEVQAKILSFRNVGSGFYIYHWADCRLRRDGGGYDARGGGHFRPRVGFSSRTGVSVTEERCRFPK